MITDMILARINVKTELEMEQVYDMLLKMTDINITRINNVIYSEDVHKIIINFIYMDMAIGEIQICIGNEAIISDGRNFLYDLVKSNSVT